MKFSLKIVVVFIQVLLSVRGNNCPAGKAVCVEERSCSNVAAGGSGGYLGCFTSQGKYGVCCSKLKTNCRRKGGPWFDCDPPKAPRREIQHKPKDDNAFPTCLTSYQQPGRCVPQKMCDCLHDRYLKKHHKKNRALEKLWVQSKCPSNVPGSSFICCGEPPSPDSFIKHSKAPRLGLDQCGTVPFGGKILQGQDAGLGQYPWMVNLMYYIRKIKTSICSGSLIHPLYVLTAAHCIQPGSQPVSVRLGDYDRSTKIDSEEGIRAAPFKEYFIDKWMPHEQYQRGHRTHDIALISLARIVKLVPGQIYPICLPLTEQMLMTKPSQLTVTGWGLTEAKTQSNVLKAATLQVMDSSEYCQQEGLICARGRNNEGHCQGDSGGPLQKVMPYNGSFRTVLFGVVSGGAATCSTRDDTPGVSTMVGYHIRWILNHMT